MVKKAFFHYYIFFLLNFLFVGCTKDVDFNQVNDFEVSPIVETSLIFFNASAGEFFIGGNELSIVQDFVVLEVFNNSFIDDNLIKSEFVLETINSINRAYDLQIDFVNNTDQLLHSFTVTAPASPTNTEVTTKHTEVFEGSSLVAFKRTTKLVYTLTMLPGLPIDANTMGKIDLKSKGVFYFNYKEEI
ncbi:hypothetical protein APS56_13875 [Pseudalgibacter alginicilyticus]|uniref:Uncharacterized protein n=1 Tax=Pseudalgibacter alginicilyticus TaxID=1736674 RepID=A0A0N7HYT5_9FLAO|nr:hypothetical protein [Pseudalgibacter alginicilyticus]ALJ06150.1 hypothetical protein APS56_13875 [Pseudalgibacter alginicilyticus]